MRIAREKWLFLPIFYNLGDFSLQTQHRVDDKPYGWWAGALLEIEPIYRAIVSIEEKFNLENKKKSMRKVYLWPRGERLTQPRIEQLSEELIDEEFILLCGHYEGVDHRVFEMFSFEEYSIWDFVVSSWELAAMVFIDAIVRLVPGVVGNNESLREESFSSEMNRKREYPQYTRPRDFMGFWVPEALLSWNPKTIGKWREENCI